MVILARETGFTNMVKMIIELLGYSFITLMFFYVYQNQWFQDNSKIIFFLYSMIYSKITIEVILAHILDEPVRTGITELWVTLIYLLITLSLLEKFEADF